MGSSLTASEAFLASTLPISSGEALSWAIVLPDVPHELEVEAGELLRRVMNARTADVRASSEPSAVIVAESAYPGNQPAVFIGNTLAARESFLGDPPIDRQAYQWSGEPGRLVLRGGSPIGTRLGLARFLHRYWDVRWFIPGELGEDIPCGPICFPVGKSVDEASFKMRSLLSMVRPNETLARNNGLAPRYEMNHNIHTYLDNALIESHPEWFPLIEGQRLPLTGGSGHQPNLGHPGFARHVAQQAIGRFKADARLESQSLSMTDSISFDESTETRQLIPHLRYFRNRPDYSNLIFTFMNRVADQVYGENPEWLESDRYLCTLAYFVCENTPDFPVHPKVIPWLTSDRACWFDATFQEQDKELIMKWAVQGPEMLGVWDYYEGYPYFVPRCNHRSIAESLPFLHLHRVRAFFAEGNAEWGFDAPKLWLAAQLLWDVHADSEALLDEFYQRYYGPAWIPMKVFFERCEQVWMAQPRPAVWLKYFVSKNQARIFNSEIVRELLAKLQEARLLALGFETSPSEEAGGSSRFWLSGKPSRFRERVELTLKALERTQALVTFCEYGSLVSALPTVTASQSSRLEILRRGALNHLQEPYMHLFTREMIAQDDPSFRGKPLPPKAVLLDSIDFESELFAGDASGLDHRVVPGIRRSQDEKNWALACWNNASFRIIRTMQARFEKNTGLNVSGAEGFWLEKRFDASPGEVYHFRGAFRGRVSGDGITRLSIKFLDAAGKEIGYGKRDALPQGQHEWIRLTAEAVAPARTRYVRASVQIMYQYAGDLMSIDALELYQSKP